MGGGRERRGAYLILTQISPSTTQITPSHLHSAAKRHPKAQKSLSSLPPPKSHTPTYTVRQNATPRHLIPYLSLPPPKSFPPTGWGLWGVYALADGWSDARSLHTATRGRIGSGHRDRDHIRRKADQANRRKSFFVHHLFKTISHPRSSNPVSKKLFRLICCMFVS